MCKIMFESILVSETLDKRHFVLFNRVIAKFLEFSRRNHKFRFVKTNHYFIFLCYSFVKKLLRYFSEIFCKTLK
jgi:hypothetical protein